MFSSIAIKNFRCFRDFRIDSLKRVNVIAGKNDVGKTALLEAIFLLMGETNLSLVINIHSFRGIRKVLATPSTIKEVLWRPIFHNFATDSGVSVVGTLPDGSTPSIEITLVTPRAASISSEEQAIGGRTGPGDALAVLDLQIRYSDGKGSTRSARMRIDDKGTPLQEPPFPGPAVPAHFLPSRDNPRLEEDADILGSLVVEKKDYDLVQPLSLLEPRLRAIAPVPGPAGSIIYGDLGLERMLPMPLMGDGVGRLAYILLRIFAARGGVVLIDEIENGFHYSVIGEVWAAIAQAARQFDVQVFATTHSWECIQAAHSAFEADGTYDFGLYRLDRMDDGIKAVLYDKETLATSILAGLEVR